VHFLRCVLAEWALVRPRLVRTRLGPWLLLTGACLVWLGHRGADPATVALYAGAFGAVLGAAFGVGADADRAALVVALTHPSTPLAVACGRWLAAVLPAAGLTVACTVAVGGTVRIALGGVATAVAVAGCALPGVLALGNGAAVVLCCCLAIAGAAPPEDLVGFAEPGLARLAAASALELGPALWRYRAVAEPGAGDAGSILHAAAWAALGIVLASGLVARRIRAR
jgi:hypothetical protein